MARKSVQQIKAKGYNQSVGAFGERAVEAELLRHGWIPANVNATVKNAADFDIYAVRGKHTVHLRIKTCGPNMKAFQFGGFNPNEPVPRPRFRKSDFTVLVKMGTTREQDQFFVVPTRIVRKEIADRQRDYMKTAKRNGDPRKDIGHWSLRFKKRKDGRHEPGYGINDRWGRYLGAWKTLNAR